MAANYTDDEAALSFFASTAPSMTPEEDEYPDSWYYGYVAATVVLFLAFGLVLLLGLSLILSPKVRRNAFDLYVLMILIPDALIVGELAVVTAQKVA